jgi:hypothetical protein
MGLLREKRLRIEASTGISLSAHKILFLPAAASVRSAMSEFMHIPLNQLNLKSTDASFTAWTP